MCARGLRLAGLLVLSLGVACTASAATRRTAATIADAAGLAPSQVSTTQLCQVPPPGVARCEAEALVLHGSHAFVRPRVAARARHAPMVLVGHAARAASVVAAVAPPDVGTPQYLQQAYDLTYLSQTGGSGDTVAIVDAYDDPTAESDLAVFRSAYGLTPCTTANRCFRKINESGAAAPLPPAVAGWEGEIALDLAAVSAVCPRCKILLVEADSAGWSDLQSAIAEAASLGAQQISNSWALASKSPPGGPVTFTGIATIAASGDQGYVAGGASNYPAGFAGVTAAGGTSLVPASDDLTPRGFSETAWSLSSSGSAGSGCNLRVAKPTYQPGTGCTGRAYSDLSADGDPATGLILYDSSHGGWTVLGGTSLSAPVIAAYYAVAGVRTPTPQWAYATAALLNDPIGGSNGSCISALWYICNAGAGYDGPTGIGSISGAVAVGAPGIGGPSDASGTYASVIGSHGATLVGGVYPNGVDTVYWWEYGPGTSYGQQTPPVDIGAGRTAVALSTDIAGLSPGATYHYRLVAQNQLGTSYGYDFTLTTTTLPGSVTGTGSTGAANATVPSVLISPSVAGKARRTRPLTARTGSWMPAVDGYTYQWQRSTGGAFVDIRGATGPSYAPVRLDEGRQLRVVVTAYDSVGSASAVSAPVGPVVANPPALAGVPVLTGRARSGAWLQYRRLAWAAVTSDTTIHIQWQRCGRRGRGCRAIAGAHASRYRLTAADAGHRVLVTITASNPDGTAKASSRLTAVVVGGRDHRAPDIGA